MQKPIKAAGALFLIVVVTFAYGCRKKEKPLTPAPIEPVVVASMSEITWDGIKCVGLPVCFTCSTTGAKSYLWTFGDGTTSTQASPCHSYADTGSFTVRLTINSDSSLTRQAPCSIFKMPVLDCMPFGTRAWRHVHWLHYSNGTKSIFDTTTVTLTLTKIDGVTISIGGHTMKYYASSSDSILTFSSSAMNSLGYYDFEHLSYQCGKVESMKFQTQRRTSAGMESKDDYYLP